MSWPTDREPLYVTLTRTGILGLLAGMIVSRLLHQPGSWLHWTAIALWITFGGHWVEIFFLNWLRPRLPIARPVQASARIATWFVGGIGLALGASETARLLGAMTQSRWPVWWVWGCGFVGVELFVHLFPSLRGRPSFYDGQG